jgi:hypothetical protein
VSGVVGALDHDTLADITLTRAIAPAFGRVVSTWTDTRDQAIDPAASVQLSGPIGFNGTNPQPGAVKLTTNGNGCFAIVPSGYDLATLNNQSPTVCGTFTTASAAAPEAGKASFVTAALTASITDDPSFVPITNLAVTLSDSNAAVSTITMRPVSDTFRGALALDPPNPSMNLSGTTIQVDTTRAPGAGNVLAFADAAGTLHWVDSNIGITDAIWPGTYTLHVSLPGFSPDQTAYTFICARAPVTCGPGTVTLRQLGTLSGTVTGFLGNDTQASTPHQPIAAASVILTCTDPACTSGTQFRTITDTGGGFSFTGNNGVGGLSRGTWQLEVSAPGWRASTSSGTTETHTIVISSTNLNPVENVNMLVDQVALHVHLTVGTDSNGNPIDYNPPGCDTDPNPKPAGCPTVVLVPVRNQLIVPPDPGSNPNSSGVYVFSNIIPLSGYTVFVIDPSATVQFTSQFVNVPLPVGVGTTQDVPVPITLTRNTVSGSVSGQQGKNGQSRLLNDIPVELGTGATPATFQTKNGTDGKPLITATGPLAGVDGAFSFNTVPNGSYTALYNDPNASGYDPTYATVVSSDVVTVFGSQAGSFAAVVLPLSTSNVTVALTPSDANDDISGTALTLTNTSDSTWVLNPQGPTTNNGTFSWTFNQVPAGSWTVTATLATNHYGRLTTGAPAMTCSVGSTTTPVKCTSAALNTKKTDQTLTYTVSEFAVGLSVVAHKLTADPNVTPPATAALTVTDGATTPNTVYSNPSFTVSTTAPTTPTQTIWGRSGTTYTATATTSVANWPFGQQDLTAAAPRTPVSLNEIGASVTVHVTLNNAAPPNNATVTVSLVPPTGSGITAPASQPTNSNDRATFDGVPFGSQWTAQATATVRQGSPPQPVQVNGSTQFTISGGTTACTGSGTSVTCSIPTVEVNMT